MKNFEVKKVFEVEIEVLDYIFFSTYEIGREYFTGQFIGNWALAFALGFIPNEFYAQNFQHFDVAIYEKLKGIKKYIFPARPKKGLRMKKFEFTTQREFFTETRVKNSQFPDFGRARVICPHSKFLTYMLDFEGDFSKDRTIIRLGKWEGQALVTFKEVKFFRREGNFKSEHYLCWEDLPQKPKFFSSIPYSKPAKIIYSAFFENSRYIVVESEISKTEIFLPIEVGYLEGVLLT